MISQLNTLSITLKQLQTATRCIADPGIHSVATDLAYKAEDQLLALESAMDHYLIPTEAADPDWLETLNELQSIIGYNLGSISIVALLGLMGEAGEVLEETILISDSNRNSEVDQAFENLINDFARSIKTAQAVDSHKKLIRNLAGFDSSVSINLKDSTAFDMELADAFYYVLALARNRGLTIQDLARTSYEKVQAKRLGAGN